MHPSAHSGCLVDVVSVDDFLCIRSIALFLKRALFMGSNIREGSTVFILGIELHNFQTLEIDTTTVRF